MIRTLFILTVISAVLTPSSADAKLKAPKPGTGLVIIELSPSMRQISDYVLLTAGKRVNGDFVQTRKMAISVNNSFPLYVDEVTGRAWFIDSVPAGETVLYGVNLQSYWQIRFDAGAPHFTVPDSGYVFVGTIDGMAIRQIIVEATKTGRLPSQIAINSGMPASKALCGEEISHYTPSQDDATPAADAERYIERTLNMDITVQVPAIEVKPFTPEPLRFSSGPTHTCFDQAKQAGSR